VTKRFLVTAASGFVGRHMISRLLDYGHQVTALDQCESLDLPVGVESLTGDFKDSNSLKHFPRQWDGVIQLAGASIPSLFTTAAPITFNLEITLNLLDHIRRSQVLLVSSCQVYAPSSQSRREEDPIVPQGRYGLSKHLVEQVASHYRNNLDIRIARPFNHLGAGLRPLS